MSTILLTGGSGFIGEYFQQYLPGSQLINLDLRDPGFSYTSTFVKGDIRKQDDVRKSVAGKGVKTIISLAAKHHDFGIGHDEYFDTNEEGTEVICKVATEQNIKEIIFFSSVAVYGSNAEASTELTQPNPDSPYGASKLAGEKVLERWAAADKERKVLIIRPAVVFGANNMANMYNLIRQIDSGLYFHLGKADNIKSIGYVENVVLATMFLKERMKPGVAIYNYADEPQLTTRQISDIIAEELQTKIRMTVPKPLGIMLGLPFDVIIRITGKNLPVSSARIRKLGTQTLHSAAKIFNEGFQPIFSTTDGLKKMVAWYKEKTRSAISSPVQ
jgi:nucleoside-diphosphate-sugar epimerase